MKLSVHNLLQALKEPTALHILETYGRGTYIAGGCLILARTLLVLFPEGKLKTLYGEIKEEPRRYQKRPPKGLTDQHVLFEMEDLLFDAEGVQTREQLLENWSKGKEGVEFVQLLLEDFEQDKLEDGLFAIPDSEEAVVELAQFLKEKL